MHRIKIWFGPFLWPSDPIYSWQFIETPCIMCHVGASSLKWIEQAEQEVRSHLISHSFLTHLDKCKKSLPTSKRGFTRGDVNSNMTKAGPLVHCALYWRWFVHSTAHHHGLGRYRPQLFLISPVPTVTSGVKVYLLTLSWVFYCRLIIDTMILMTVCSIWPGARSSRHVEV